MDSALRGDAQAQSVRATTLLLAALLGGCGDGDTAPSGPEPSPEPSPPIPNTQVPPGPEEIPPGAWSEPPRDATGALVPRWTFCPNGATLGWTGVVDAAGRSYWLEGRDFSTSVASLGREGDPRFSTPVTIPALYGPWHLLLAGGLLIAVHDRAAEAFRIEDGSSAWTVELSAAALARWMDDPRVGTLSPLVEAPARGGDDLLVPFQLLAWPDDRYEEAEGTVVVALDLGTGAVRWATRVHFRWNGAGVLGNAGGGGWAFASDELVRLDADGSVVWRAGAKQPVAGGDGVLLDWSGATWSAATGEARGGTGTPGPSVIGDGFVVAREERAGEPTLVKRRLPDNDVVWRRTYEEAGPADAQWYWVITDVALTEAGTLLTIDRPYIVRTGPAREPVLTELDLDGNVLLRAPLPGASTGPLVVRGGRMWLTSWDERAGLACLRCYDLPGRTIASHGWATTDGALERDRRLDR
jgi:hypothetical protein